MRIFCKCGTAAALLATVAMMAMPSFAGDKMAGHKMSGSKMSSHRPMKGGMDAGDAAVWKKAMLKVGNADRSTMGKMSPEEKAVVVKLLKK